MATSLLEVAKAMSTESSGEEAAKRSLLDVAKADVVRTDKPVTLLEVTKREHEEVRSVGSVWAKEEPKNLQQLARDLEMEERSETQDKLNGTAREVTTERQTARWQELQAAATDVERQDGQAARDLSAKTTTRSSECVSKTQSVAEPTQDALETKEVAGKTTEDAEDGYSSFEDDGDSSDDEKPQAAKKVVNQEDADECEEMEAPTPPKTTPCESTESKELLRAVFHGDKYRVRELLEDKDMNVDAKTADQHGWSGLHWAASQNHSGLLTLLLQRGAEVNAVDQLNGWTALHVAAVRQAVACVELLLAAGADARIKDAYGDTVTDCLQAARGKKVSMLQLVREFRVGKP